MSGVLRSPAGFHILSSLIPQPNSPDGCRADPARHSIKVQRDRFGAEPTRIARGWRDRSLRGATKFEDHARRRRRCLSARAATWAWYRRRHRPRFEQALAISRSRTVQPCATIGLAPVAGEERRQQAVTQERSARRPGKALRQRKSDEAFQEFVADARPRVIELRPTRAKASRSLHTPICWGRLRGSDRSYSRSSAARCRRERELNL